MDKRKRQKDHFNKIAETYFKTRRGKRQRLLHALLYKELFHRVSLNKEKIRVLEPMCGFGEGKEIAERFFKQKIEYEGFDYSEEIVGCAKKLDPQVKIYVQDVTTYQSKEKWDMILIIGGLHHVPDYAGGVLENCCSMLEDDGILVNVEPTYNNFIYKIACEYIYKKNSVFDEDTERRFSLRELNELYKRSGLKITRQLYPGLLAYLFWYNPDVFPGLNKGKLSTVKKVFAIDKKLMYGIVGRKCSVATFTVLKKEQKRE